jgi:hypothetical protein
MILGGPIVADETFAARTHTIEEPMRSFRPHLPKRSRTIARAALLATIAGCNSDSPTDAGLVGLGAASVKVTGAVTRSFSGNAAFNLNVLGSNEFSLVLAGSDGSSEVAVQTKNSTRPGLGSITLGDSRSGQYAELSFEDAGGKVRFFPSVTGQLTISASSAQSMQGTISFRGREEFGTAEVDVSATFNAVCLPNGVATC